MNLFLSSLIIIILIGILVNNIIKFYQNLMKSIKTFKNKKFNNNYLNWDELLNDKLEEYIYLNSFIKWKIYIYILSFSLLTLNTHINLNNTIQIIIGSICILAVGDFIHSAHRFANNDFFNKILFSCLTLIVLIIYILQFNIVFVEENFNFSLLLIITIISIFYTFLFIKSIVDIFESYLVQFISFILILLIFNFIIIGFNFGLFYLVNNELFEYYQIDEVEKIVQSFQNEQLINYEYVTIVIYEGLGPFFNFPDRIMGQNGFVGFIPLIEHFIGNVFNLFIVGFFVSYSVTNLFERRNKLSKFKN